MCVSHAEQAEVKVQQRHEHEDEEDAASELQEVLRRTLMTERRNSCKHTASLPPTLRQQEEQTSPQRQVPARRRGRGDEERERRRGEERSEERKQGEGGRERRQGERRGNKERNQGKRRETRREERKQ